LRPSFETICSVGSNAAIIHYKAKKTTCKPLQMNDILLLDSGGHYSNAGTTDVTRTVFLGDATLASDHLKDCFTRVLKGHIQLSLRVFPNNTNPVLLDSFARQALWDVGLNYGHGTGHGVGFLLNVHELPFMGTRKTSLGTIEIGLQENMIVTIEPGFYEEGQFGIRIENCERIVVANTPFKFNGQKFLTFEPLTYVPIQRELIKKSIMTVEEITWLNNYHEKCRLNLSDQLIQSNNIDLYNWLIDKTKPI
jgi:Xaa-Pro aminopeptidase